METIILGTPAQFHLGLVDSTTGDPVSVQTFLNTTFTFSVPNIISANADADPFFFTVTPLAVGFLNMGVQTTAHFSDGTEQAKAINFDVSVVAATPDTTLTVTRV